MSIKCTDFELETNSFCKNIGYNGIVSSCPYFKEENPTNVKKLDRTTPLLERNHAVDAVEMSRLSPGLSVQSMLNDRYIRQGRVGCPRTRRQTVPGHFQGIPTTTFRYVSFLFIRSAFYSLLTDENIFPVPIVPLVSLSHIRSVIIIKPVGRILETAIRSGKGGKCGRSLSPHKNKNLRRFRGAKTAENADMNMPKRGRLALM